MESITEPKKKRGRKPKNKETTIVEEPVKKKRGRKPKVKVEGEEEQVKIPKKRGRKPLDINKNIETFIKPKKEENIILQIPIKTEDIQNQTSESIIIKYNQEIPTPMPFSLDNNYQTIDLSVQNHSKEIENKEEFVSENKDVLKNYEKICDNYNNNSSFYEKNKVLPILVQYNETNKNKKWPESVNINCLWCCEKFDSIPVGIPIKKVENTFHMFGNFCSPECAAAYIFDDKRFINDCWEKYSMLNNIYSDKTPIKIAPPKICLKKFGGRFSINEFRSICTQYNKSYKILLPPMISVLPVMEEINLNDNNNDINTFLINKEHLNKANEEYRLKRTKPLPESKNTLETCMQLKVL